MMSEENLYIKMERLRRQNKLKELNSKSHSWLLYLAGILFVLGSLIFLTSILQ